MRLSGLISNVSSLQAFQLVRYGTLLLISILFAKSNLSQSDIGIYESLIFLAGAISFFWVTGLTQSFLPLFNSNKSLSGNKRNAIYFNVFIIFLIFSIISFLFIFFLKDYISNKYLDSKNNEIINLFLLYILFSTPSFLIEYFFLVRNKPVLIMIYGGVSYFLQLILVGLPPFLGYGLYEIVMGLAIIAVLRFILLIFLLIRYSSFTLSFQFIKEHLGLGAPLMLSVLLSGSAQYIDGFLVSNYFDNKTFAVFRYGAREFPLAVILANALSQAMLPEFSKENNLNNALKKLKRKVARLQHVMFPLSILLMIFSKYIFEFVFNQNFIESYTIFNIYLLLVISKLIFPQTILIGLKKTKYILIASAFELIINLGFSLILINYFGIQGVAIATVIAFFFEKTLLIVFNYRILNIKPSKYINVTSLTIYSILLLATYFLFSFSF